ncbi:hypothetical protein LROSL1_p10003 (plasmid) [Furfurilactobacillus rossiae]|nr:hypothetical protein LROSL1_p10003 [Furfurilactobacillus rossiae]
MILSLKMAILKTFLQLLFQFYLVGSSPNIWALFFLNFTSEVGVTNSFGFILIIVALIGFSLLFNAARHDIVTRKKTVQQAQKKYFRHNQVLTFSMVHYVIGISSVVIVNSIVYLPIFLDFFNSDSQKLPW